MKKKSEKMILIFFAIALVVGVIGITYAWFSAQVLGNDTASVMTVKTADLKLLFTDTNILKLDRALPGASASKTFTVENTGNAVASYDIVIVGVSSSFEGRDLVYTLTSDNGGGSKTETVLPNTDDTIVANISINPRVIQTYTITITFKETGLDQNIDQGKSYAGKLQILPRVASVAVSGYVTGANNLALANKTVEIHSDIVSAVTATNGFYNISNVPVGTHTLYIKEGDTILASKEITVALGVNTEIRNGNTIVVAQSSTKYVNIKVNAGNTIDLSTSGATLLLNESSGDLYIGGDSKELTISGTGYGALSCATSDNTKATCSINGNTLTITPGTVTGTGKITVTEATLNNTAEYNFELKSSSVALSPNSGTAYVGGNYLSSAISGTNMGDLYCGTSSDQIATCSINGNTLIINPVGAGEATITVREDNGNKTATYTATISTTTIALSPLSGTLVTGGATATSTISGTNLGTLSCTSNNQNAATCSINGNTLTIISGSTAGEARITVSETNGGQTATYTATTVATTISLASSSGTFGAGGSSKSVTVNGTNMGTLSCTSDNASAAGCSVAGNTLTIIPGATAGTAVITVTEGNAGLTATYTATVVATSISLSPNSGDLETLGSAKTSTISGTNMGTLSCSSNRTTVATCSISGTTLTVTPGSTAGTATITVTEATGNKTATYTATVEEYIYFCYWPTYSDQALIFAKGEVSSTSTACSVGCNEVDDGEMKGTQSYTSFNMNGITYQGYTCKCINGDYNQYYNGYCGYAPSANFS